jgi:hypothetical protein
MYVFMLKTQEARECLRQPLCCFASISKWPHWLGGWVSVYPRRAMLKLREVITSKRALLSATSYILTEGALFFSVSWVWHSFPRSFFPFPVLVSFFGQLAFLSYLSFSLLFSFSLFFIFSFLPSPSSFFLSLLYFG